MGTTTNIDRYQFPRQSGYVGRRVDVAFHWDTENTISGTVVRDDMEEPWKTILRLDDGRYLLSTECQYSFVE